MPRHRTVEHSKKLPPSRKPTGPLAARERSACQCPDPISARTDLVTRPASASSTSRPSKRVIRSAAARSARRRPRTTSSIRSRSAIARSALSTGGTIASAPPYSPCIGCGRRRSNAMTNRCTTGNAIPSNPPPNTDHRGARAPKSAPPMTSRPTTTRTWSTSTSRTARHRPAVNAVSATTAPNVAFRSFMRVAPAGEESSMSGGVTMMGDEEMAVKVGRRPSFAGRHPR